MKQSPSSSEANTTVPQLIKKFPTFYVTCAHRCPPLVWVLSQTNPIHPFPLYFFKIYSNIIFPLMPWFPKWSLSSSFSPKTVHVSSPPYMPHAPPILSYFISSPKCTTQKGAFHDYAIVPKSWRSIHTIKLFSFQLLTQVKIGPKDGTQLTTRQKFINKSLWLIGTARNAILVVVCCFVGYQLEDSGAIKLTGKYHVHAFYTYSHFTAQDTLF